MAIKFLNQVDLTVTSSLLKTDANGVIVAAVAGTDYLSTLPAHNHDDRYYTETESDARFLRKDADTTLTGTLFVDAVNGGSIAYSDPVGVYIPRPQGASYKTSTDAHTGAITVRLPGSIPADMLSFWVDVYDYAGNPEGESFSVYVYGYAYQTTTPWWTNVGALILSDRTDKSFTVRFGWDGTNHVVCIGETNSTWNYPQVVVRDFQAGYTADSSTFDDNWSIAFLTTLPSIGQTASNNYPVARSAFQLSTARSINGTNFDGTANITTANWGTARTITIGATGKSVNGSGNVSWTLGELQAEYQVPTNTIRNNLGDPTVREMALFHGQFNNKFRFIAPTLQEESTDGTTWVTSTRATAAQLGDMMIGEGQGTSFNAIPSAAVGTYGAYRLTWNVVGSTGYVFLNALYIYNSTNGNNVTVQIEAYHNTNGWVNITGPHTTSNWPGHAYIPHSAIYYSNSASQYSQVRITFTTTHNTNTNAFALYGIEWFGGYPQGRRNAEYYDRDKNVYFPAYVNGSRMVTSAVMANGTGGLAFKTSDGSDRMFLNNSGNFGIGTSSPGFPLHVIGKIYANPNHPVAISGGGNPYYGSNITMASDIGSTAGAVRIWSRYDGSGYAATSFERATNSQAYGQDPQLLTYAESMRISGTGNVGIGTTSPSYKLDISTSQSIRVIGSSNGYTQGSIIFQSSTTDSPGARGLGVYLFNEGNDATWFYGTGYGAGDTFLINRKSGATYQDSAAAPAESSNFFAITNAGNVGIGTTSPSTKLHVNSAGGSGVTTQIKVTQADDGAGHPGADAILESSGWGEAYLKLGGHKLGAYGGILNIDSSSHIAFNLGGERVRITSAGNVGIGTTAPTSKLYIEGGSADWNETTPGLSVGTIHLDPGTDTNDYGNAITFGASDAGGGTNAQAGIYLRSDGNYGTKMYFATTDSYAAGSKTRMFIGHDGNVGIGTTTPLRKLHIAGNFAVNANGSQYYGVYIPANGEGASPTILIGDWWNASGNLTWDSSNKIFNINSLYGSNAAPITFSGNGTERMRIAAGGNVGIGTTNPTEKLDVAGSGKIQGNLFLTAADPYIEGSGSGAMRIKHTAGQVMYIRPDQTGNVVFFEGASGQTVYLNTASPSVNSTQNSSSTLTFEARARNAGGTLNIKSTSLQNTVYDIANNLSRFSITGQDVLYLEGNVGIGTNNPAQKLHVAGNGRFEGNVGIGHGSAAEYFLEIGQGRTGNGFAYIDLIGDATYTDYGLRIIRNNSGANTPSSINHRGLGTFSLNAEDAAPIAFLTSSSERMRISSTGNVGIGTNSPAYTLDIATASSPTVRITRNGATDLRLGASIIGTGALIGTYSSAPMSFVTNSAVQAVITTAGNVGIGTTAPNTKLEIQGADSSTVQAIFQATDGQAAYRGGIQLGNASGNQNSQIYHNSSGDNTLTFVSNYSAGTGNKFIFAPGGTERVRFLQNGNVGIGNTAPTARLDIVGDSAVFKVSSVTADTNLPTKRLAEFAGIYNSGANGHQMFISSTSGLGSWEINQTKTWGGIMTFGVSTNSTEITRHLAIDSSGNVGIGTTSPAYKLDVAGEGKVTGKFRVGGAVMLAEPGTGVLLFGSEGGDQTAIYSASLERIRINISGNVGIGTTSPSERLDVSGNARTSGFVLVNNHSDNTLGYRISNTSGTAVSAMFVNSSNQLVIAAGAVDQVNLNKKVLVNGVALGVNVAPSATAGRIDASNDIVAYSSSDERLKQNITPIENALDKVKSLTGVEFDWKPEYKDAHGYEGHDTGVIAQQVEAVMPSAVRTNDTGFLAVRYEKLIGLLIEGMKEQQAQIDELKAKLDGLTK